MTFDFLWRQRWVHWLVILIVLSGVIPGLGMLLIGQKLVTFGVVVVRVGLILAALWTIGGVFAFAQPRWLLWSLIYLGLHVLGQLLAYSFVAISNAPGVGIAILGVAGFVRLCLIFRAYDARASWRVPVLLLVAAGEVLILCAQCLGWGYMGTAIAIAGMFFMAAMFLICMAIIRFVLSPGIGALAVARTVIEEALRMKVVLVLVVLIMLIVPILPFTGQSADPAQPTEMLKYRIGAFLAWSLWSTAILLSLMTIFLSCWTICGEVRLRQIHLTLTKPISRAHYLFGKWVGICLLNLLLLVVIGVAIYAYARFMERAMPERNRYDRQAVAEQVLTARISLSPHLKGGGSVHDLVRQHFLQLKDAGALEAAPGVKDFNTALNQQVNRWHTVKYLGRQTYVFSGLEALRGKAETVQLKLKPVANEKPDSGVLHFKMAINGRPFRTPQEGLVHDQVHVLPIPTKLIDDQGRLEIEIINQNPTDKQLTAKSDISFTPDEGMQLLLRYGEFGPNLGRVIFIIWVQLCFLAMVGLAAGTSLGFPVACLLSLVVYFTALFSSYLTEALTYYAVVDNKEADLWLIIKSYPAKFQEKLAEGKVWDAIKVVIRVVGQMVVALVPAFTKEQYNPMPLIADGRAVPYGMVIRTVLAVGIVWTSITGLIAFLIFRCRELARVTV